MQFKKILIWILVGFSLLFIVQNLAFVETQFLFWSFSLPRAVLLLVGITTGILIGWLWHGHLIHKDEEEKPL
ncbi:MAG: DUF1049 domain-containing protein [Helicobacteraceae bacterium]|jgi:uncharacterized integral membrane protein|nr:DUF1049 domain-containing protein [Helicobacteraceae bacterium]